MNVTVTKKPKATLELNIVVPNEKVKETHDALFEEVIKNTEIKGFRKGQAPRELVEEKTDVSKMYGEVINSLLQTYYSQALKENHIVPVANPKVEIKEFDIEKDFEFVATVPVRPEVEIGDYKKEIEKIYEEKSKELRKLNAERLKNGEKLEHAHAHLTTDDVLEGLLKVTKVEFADILIDDETDRMMSRLVDQAQSIGLSLDQYLKSHNKSADDLRNDYKEIAVRNLKAEFSLSELIEREKIEVSNEEIDEMISASGDESAAKELNTLSNRMYIKSILLKNKLIAKIVKEIEGDPHALETHEENKGGKHAE